MSKICRCVDCQMLTGWIFRKKTIENELDAIAIVYLARRYLNERGVSSFDKQKHVIEKILQSDYDKYANEEKAKELVEFCYNNHDLYGEILYRIRIFNENMKLDYTIAKLQDVSRLLDSKRKIDSTSVKDLAPTPEEFKEKYRGDDLRDAMVKHGFHNSTVQRILSGANTIPITGVSAMPTASAAVFTAPSVPCAYCKKPLTPDRSRVLSRNYMMHHECHHAQEWQYFNKPVWRATESCDELWNRGLVAHLRAIGAKDEACADILHAARLTHFKNTPSKILGAIENLRSLCVEAKTYIKYQFSEPQHFIDYLCFCTGHNEETVREALSPSADQCVETCKDLLFAPSIPATLKILLCAKRLRELGIRKTDLLLESLQTLVRELSEGEICSIPSPNDFPARCVNACFENYETKLHSWEYYEKIADVSRFHIRMLRSHLSIFPLTHEELFCALYDAVEHYQTKFDPAQWNSIFCPIPEKDAKITLSHVLRFYVAQKEPSILLKTADFCHQHGIRFDHTNMLKELGQEIPFLCERCLRAFRHGDSITAVYQFDPTSIAPNASAPSFRTGVERSCDENEHSQLDPIPSHARTLSLASGKYADASEDTSARSGGTPARSLERCSSRNARNLGIYAEDVHKGGNPEFYHATCAKYEPTTPEEELIELHRTSLSRQDRSVGNRNQTLWRLAGKMRNGGISNEETIARVLEGVGATMNPPLTPSEVQRIVGTIRAPMKREEMEHVKIRAANFPVAELMSATPGADYVQTEMETTSVLLSRAALEHSNASRFALLRPSAERALARQCVKLARDPLAALLTRHLAPDDDALRGRLALFLTTELGTALLGSVLSLGLSRSERFASLAREVRVGAMTGVANTLVGALLEPVRRVLALPEPEALKALGVEHER